MVQSHKRGRRVSVVSGEEIYRTWRYYGNVNTDGIIGNRRSVCTVYVSDKVAAGRYL